MLHPDCIVDHDVIETELDTCVNISQHETVRDLLNFLFIAPSNERVEIIESAAHVCRNYQFEPV